MKVPLQTLVESMSFLCMSCSIFITLYLSCVGRQNQRVAHALKLLVTVKFETYFYTSEIYLREY